MLNPEEHFSPVNASCCHFCSSRAGGGVRVQPTGPGGKGGGAGAAGAAGPPDPGRDQLQSDAVQHVCVSAGAPPSALAGLCTPPDGFKAKHVD